MNHTNPSSYSPAFNSYLNTNLADIAARVTTEFPPADDDFLTDIPEETLQTPSDDDDDFEFDLSNLPPHDAAVYPLFNRDLLADVQPQPDIKIQLKSLFLEDRDPPSSSSSEAGDDLDEIPPGTYCAWAPTSSPSPGRCTKSNSTGSTVSVAPSGKAKWKLTEFLKRSKSDGKEGLIVLSSSSSSSSSPKKVTSTSTASGEKPRRVGAAREGYYRDNSKNKNKRRESYLPYRQDLVGLFATPQALRKIHLPPF